MKPYFVGLTGGIGSGKTTVSDILFAQGAYIIDADVVSREVLSEGGNQVIAAEFGEGFFDNGVLNRAALREYVFPNHVDRLNNALAPLIREGIEREMRRCESLLSVEHGGYKAVFVVVPLLFEQGYDRAFSEVWSVVSDEDLRIKRVVVRDNNCINSVRHIINSQTSDEVRAKGSSVVIANNGSVEELRQTVVREYAKLEMRLSNLENGF